MQSAKAIFANLLNTMLPNRAAPALARVLKSYEGPGANKYACDVRILKAGTLEDTEQVISEVPLSPLWASKKKRGVYAIPPAGQVVIVEFLEWNPAFPYIAGIWGDEYEADTFKQGQFIITDGDAVKVIIDSNAKTVTVTNGSVTITLKGSKAALRNGSQSLFTIMDAHFQNLMAMTDAKGVPVNGKDIAKFQIDKANWSALLEA
jgi:hypothetical protein